jgi:ferrous iron transport protein B
MAAGAGPAGVPGAGPAGVPGAGPGAGRGKLLVALGGNPNAGKTTLFNALTGSRARVGNYPRVTVEKRVGELLVGGGGAVEVRDVPGTYSLVARSAEEQLALSAMVGMGGERRPDVVVLCVDATQLVRGLYVVLQVLELGLPVVVALTMIDEAGESAPDVQALASKLGCPVVPVIAPRRQGLDRLQAAIAERLRGGPGKEIWHWRPSRPLEGAVARARANLPPEWPSSDAMALWALMSLDSGDELAGIPDDLRAAAVLEPALALAVDAEAIRARYDWLDREVAPLVLRPPDRRRSERVDRVLIHPLGGLFFFFLIMFVVFQALFAWATPMMDLIDGVFAAASSAAQRILPEGLLADFVSQALIKGVGQVVIFLPQILLLFFFLGLLEDSGYMARVAYLMDRIMRSMNLHGRAFVPILSGFACAVPAIMATRTMERRRDRLLTMMVVPLTTCSARLPVYTLIIASLFPAGYLLGFLPVRGLLMVFMYAFGLGTALVAAIVLSRVVKPLKARKLPFVIELPPYRLPRLRDVLHMMWERSRMFLSEAGTVILACSVVIWALLSFPREPQSPSRDYAALTSQAASDEARQQLDQAREGERIQQSYAGRLGHAIEPALEPMGFDWKIGVGLIGAFAAREVFISTLGMIYGMGEDVGEDDQGLRERMQAERRPDGSPVYTPLVGLTLMIFFSLCCQCMSTLAVVRRETASWRWPIFLFSYMTALAWLVGTAVYQTGRALGLS